MYMSISPHVCMCATSMLYPGRPEEGMDPLELEIFA